jgi:hypothetical protein
MQGDPLFPEEACNDSAGSMGQRELQHQPQHRPDEPPRELPSDGIPLPTESSSSGGSGTRFNTISGKRGPNHHRDGTDDRVGAPALEHAATGRDEPASGTAAVVTDSTPFDPHPPMDTASFPTGKRSKREWLAYRGSRQTRVGGEYQVTSLPPCRGSATTATMETSSSLPTSDGDENGVNETAHEG